MKAAIYARFSSTKQNDRSIEDQVAICRALCEREGFTIVGIYEDRATSGASTINRIGLQRLMRDAPANFPSSFPRRWIASPATRRTSRAFTSASHLLT